MTKHTATPDSAKRLVAHLATWGEIAEIEVSRMAGAADWLQLFQQAGLVTPVEDAGGVCAWSLSKRYVSILSMSEEYALRTALFQVPDYRRYLIGILAEGLTTAAKHNMQEQIEAWTGAELLPLLDDINAVFDELEIYGKRLIDETTAQITAQCAALPGRKTDWTAWNQLLLKGTGRSSELFEFVRQRFVPHAVSRPGNHDDRAPALLPTLPLIDANGHLDVSPDRSAAWNIRRTRVHSSLPLFDERGQPLAEMREPEVLRQTLQDALLEQPFYKATVHLAISSYRAQTALTAAVELFLPPGEYPGAVAVLFEGSRIAPLQHLLPELLRCQNCFCVTEVRAESVAAMLENLLALEILQRSDDNIVLHPDFQSSLMAKPRLKNVYRPGKALQAAMFDVIKAYAGQT